MLKTPEPHSKLATIAQFKFFLLSFKYFLLRGVWKEILQYRKKTTTHEKNICSHVEKHIIERIIYLRYSKKHHRQKFLFDSRKTRKRKERKTTSATSLSISPRYLFYGACLISQLTKEFKTPDNDLRGGSEMERYLR